MVEPESGPERSPRSPIPAALLAIGALALLVRVLHSQSLLSDPLYWNPLGGNLPLLIAAESIAGGDLVPFDGPISLNSPLYPYLLAGLYKVFGVNAFYEVRLAGAAVDAGTCVLVATIAWRRFGRVAGWAAGLALALYGPMIFFSVDLNPVPWTLFLLTAGIALLDGPARPARFGAAGLLLGLAAGTRPNVLLAGVMALAVPWVRSPELDGGGHRGRVRLTAVIALGVACGVAPVTLLNVAASGRPVLLTTSAGHNFYIGHNPEARAQYSLPANLDGDIFESMKALAESVEGRPMADTEISGWYFERGMAHLATDPAREAQLLGERALLLFNRFEATTYANPEYQSTYSDVLRWAPGMPVLLFFALPGMLLGLRREYWPLWIPLATAAATVLLFFYVARLRIVMVPTLALFAGAAVKRAVTLCSDGPDRLGRAALGVAALVGLLGFGLASLPMLESDTSNEWNKAGGLLRVAERYEEATAAFDRAIAANPDNPDSYRNLAVLYRETGRPEEAARAVQIADSLAASDAQSAADFRRALEGRHD